MMVIRVISIALGHIVHSMHMKHNDIAAIFSSSDAFRSGKVTRA